MVDSLYSGMDNLSLRSASDHGTRRILRNSALNNSNHGRGTRTNSNKSTSPRHSSFRTPAYSNSRHDSFGGSNHGKSLRKSTNFGTNNGGYDPLASSSNHSTRSTGSFQHSYKKPQMPQKQQYLAADCEMVGVSGESVAARVVLIDWKGRKVLDSYMKPEGQVTDYRTFVSGIQPEHLVDAPPFDDVVEVVREFLSGKILVGHGIDNDLRALGLEHPWLMTRDTAYYQPFMKKRESSTNMGAAAGPVWGPRKLKELAKEKLQRDIQVQGVSHCPVEDAAAALDLYKSHRPRWEACMSAEGKQLQQMQAEAEAVAAYQYAMASNFHNGSSPGMTTSYHSASSSVINSDLSASVHSYFHYNGAGKSHFQGSLNGSNHQHLAHTGLSTGYQQQLNTNNSLDGHSYHGSLDARSYYTPNACHRSNGMGHVEERAIQNQDQDRRSSFGYDSSYHTTNNNTNNYNNADSNAGASVF